jgi:hypothetical protein
MRGIRKSSSAFKMREMKVDLVFNMVKLSKDYKYSLARIFPG